MVSSDYEIGNLGLSFYVLPPFALAESDETLTNMVARRG